ncbi:enoyl-CoA hydratase [Pseudomonas sp. Leaf58]|uniref:enoyl-CoA hydratase n=1 Tax=Pseudomonas sp. Leaf58 TaxID=1736226 RepID=UPI0006F3D204|nr:enoyl-CoA hydratase [Pseudomonas sp. Leaf58]AYG45422.1 enoyl-CoA hydratase [Pseudomonas sp. Leaf58]KQN58668.1 enoyl-CoA hydratase [Pseudomonas sp. Leaf58]
MHEILTQQTAGVLVVTFNRPARKNAFTTPMYQALRQILESAAHANDIHAVVLQGSASVFSAGNDLNDFIEFPPLAAHAPVWQLLHALNDFPKPLVAAVCGLAVGIGSTLLLHCDLVYAATDARFSLPFVNLGVCPEGASTLLLPRLLGYQVAAEALMTGEPFDADFALQAGWVNRLLPAAEVQAWALAQAHKLAQKPSAALIQTKRLLKLGMQAEVSARINAEAQAFATLLQAPAAQTAIAAFAQRPR